MFIHAFSAVLLFVLQVTAATFQRQPVLKTSNDEDCPKGVHIVGVRGTMEDPGFGAMKPLVDKLMEKLPGSDNVAIDYPAEGFTKNNDGTFKFNYFAYLASENKGYRNFLAEIEDFNSFCPDTGIVVMGYSQGAQIVGDGLCGSKTLLFPRKSPVDPEVTASIRAIIQFGDPSNAANLTWQAGNSTGEGMFPRQPDEDCKELRGKWQSYCDSNDVFCDSGESFDVHFHYAEEYFDDVIDFVVGKAKGSRSGGSRSRVKNGDL